MADDRPTKATSDDNMSAATAPLVFISHDARDAELAEAFGKLLKSVSAGMLKTFRSSDKKGADGIDFGDEWYKRLMSKLQITTDVVCLFTERSLERPWILFEAGVAKGKLSTPVIGVALGVPLNRVTTGPFYQFQNMDDSEADLIKLVNQLARRVPSLELDADVVKTQVEAFKTTEANVLKAGAVRGDKKPTSSDLEDSAVAKLVEEMKSLPARITERLAEDSGFVRRRRRRHWHPIMIEELAHMPAEPGDPIPILMAASMVREDAPWLYELTMEVYRAVKSGNAKSIDREVHRMRFATEMMMHGPWMREFDDKESQIMLMEYPRMLERLLQVVFAGNRSLDSKSSADDARVRK